MNDGIVFKLFGQRYIIRKRKYKSRPFEIIFGEHFRCFHYGKVSFYVLHRN
jgi:hypothetical protein